MQEFLRTLKPVRLSKLPRGLGVYFLRTSRYGELVESQPCKVVLSSLKCPGAEEIGSKATLDVLRCCCSRHIGD